MQSTNFDLAEVGYVQEEYFLSGTARAFTTATPLGNDGHWTVTPGEATAPYKTRMVVYRPIERRKFNGTVVVEWLNVSGGVDAAPDWTLAHTEFTRSGYVWVGVSAQFTGVEGGPGLVPIPGLDGNLGLKQVNPARYGSLVHPGDSFSYDIFSQAAQALRHPSGPGALGTLTIKKVIATGESQSAFRMVTYVNAIHPLTHLFDGFFVHSRGTLLPSPLSQSPQTAIPTPGIAPIRSDIDVPVLMFETETDLTFLGFAATIDSITARQADAKNFRLWEVAGTAHADAYLLKTGMSDRGTSPSIVDLEITNTPIGGIVQCSTPINAGPQHFVAKAAFAALQRWVRHGKAPKSAPRLELEAGPGVTIRTDTNGNAVGGIRTPQVDVPLATFTGQQGPGSSLLCLLLGTTTPFDATKLQTLYPTHRGFVAAYGKSLKRAVKAGYILRPDAKLMKTWAAGSSIGN